jgi:hypothetical protein
MFCFGEMALTQLLLKSLEKLPRKRWGQNFPVDKNIAFKSLLFVYLGGID